MKSIGIFISILCIALLGATMLGRLAPNDQRDALGVRVSYQDALKAMDDAYAVHGHSYEFVATATSIYASAIDYSWPVEIAQTPITDNWILHLLGYIDGIFVTLKLSNVPAVFTEFESLDYRRGFRRGYGICSQNATAFVDLLEKRYNIEARQVVLEGHVVLESAIEDARIHDPSVGLSFPFSAQEAPAYLPLLEAEYTRVGHGELAPYYNLDGNIYDDFGTQAIRPKVYLIERISDYVKWVLPILGLLVGFALVRR